MAVVQNGIIENYRSLRKGLESEGVQFVSDTDTEVIPHLISRELKNGFEIHFGFSNIDWNNANFNPFISEQEGLVNSNKNSFSFGFSYNFDIFTQSSKIDNNSVYIYLDELDD